jgi:hypothetical protein
MKKTKNKNDNTLYTGIIWNTDQYDSFEKAKKAGAVRVYTPTRGYEETKKNIALFIKVATMLDWNSPDTIALALKAGNTELPMVFLRDVPELLRRHNEGLPTGVSPWAKSR